MKNPVRLSHYEWSPGSASSSHLVGCQVHHLVCVICKMAIKIVSLTAHTRSYIHTYMHNTHSQINQMKKWRWYISRKILMLSLSSGLHTHYRHGSIISIMWTWGPTCTASEPMWVSRACFGDVVTYYPPRATHRAEHVVHTVLGSHHTLPANFQNARGYPVDFFNKCLLWNKFRFTSLDLQEKFHKTAQGAPSWSPSSCTVNILHNPSMVITVEPPTLLIEFRLVQFLQFSHSSPFLGPESNPSSHTALSHLIFLLSPALEQCPHSFLWPWQPWRTLLREFIECPLAIWLWKPLIAQFSKWSLSPRSSYWFLCSETSLSQGSVIEPL